MYLRRVIKAEPSNFHFQYELGQTLRQSGDLQGAVAAFEKALEINPELREGYYGLGLSLKQQSASAHKRSAPSASPADEGYRQAQETAAAKGDLNSAKELLTKALLADEHHAEAHNLLGAPFGVVVAEAIGLEFERTLFGENFPFEAAADSYDA